jgi:hypothetical protein
MEALHSRSQQHIFSDFKRAGPGLQKFQQMTVQGE